MDILVSLLTALLFSVSILQMVKIRMTSGPGKNLVYIPFSSACCVLSHVQLFATLQTVAHKASLSMVFSSLEYWSGLPFTSPGNLANQGIKPMSPALAGRFFTTCATLEVHNPFYPSNNWSSPKVTLAQLHEVLPYTCTNLYSVRLERKC